MEQTSSKKYAPPSYNKLPGQKTKRTALVATYEIPIYFMFQNRRKQIIVGAPSVRLSKHNTLTRAAIKANPLLKRSQVHCFWL